MTMNYVLDSNGNTSPLDQAKDSLISKLYHLSENGGPNPFKIDFDVGPGRDGTGTWTIRVSTPAAEFAVLAYDSAYGDYDAACGEASEAMKAIGNPKDLGNGWATASHFFPAIRCRGLGAAALAEIPAYDKHNWTENLLEEARRYCDKSAVLRQAIASGLFAEIIQEIDEDGDDEDIFTEIFGK